MVSAVYIIFAQIGEDKIFESIFLYRHVELEALRDFHGHLGPYVVVGFKMGKLACKKLGRGKGLRCRVKTGLVTPLSCIIDGIQFSSSCTLGKGNIVVMNEGVAEAEFTKGDRELKIRLKSNLRKEIDERMKLENDEKLGLWIYKLEDEKLFDYFLG